MSRQPACLIYVPCWCVCFFYRGTCAHHFEIVEGGKNERLILVNVFFLRTLFVQVLVTHSMSLGLYLS